jgi:hypothetical protein
MAVETNGIARAVAENPRRRPGKFEDEELEVTRLAKSDEMQSVDVYTIEHREYMAPFKYPNFNVELGRDHPNSEYNMDGVEIDVPPHGAITLVEDDPIIGVTVIGSSCSPPGTVLLHAEPVEWKFPRTGVKMKVDNLWGEHIVGHQWFKGITEDWREAGFSTCHFNLPECSKVTLMGWSQAVIGQKEINEYHTNDGHYCFRIVRTTTKKSSG